MKREMRRKDRMISEEECLKALEEAEYGSLATISEDGTPYITPLNFVYTDVHCISTVLKTSVTNWTTSPGITMHVSASWTPWN